MKIATTVAAIVLAAQVAPALAGDQQLTVAQCIGVLNGLSALNYVGQQYMSQSPAPANATQYKLGALRVTIALDIAALQPVAEGLQKAGQDIARETEAAIPDAKDVAAINERRAARNGAELQKVLNSPCSANLTKLSLADLRVGDDSNQNQIPPTVIAALMPILVTDKTDGH